MDRTWYYMTHPAKTEAEIYERFNEVHDRMREQYNKQREREQLKREIIDEVMKRITIEIKNEASPAIQDLKKQLSTLGK